jgi:hypothetical protein
VTRNIVSTIAALALAAIAGVALGAQAPQQTPAPKPSPSPSPATTLAGKWTMSLEIPMGTATVALEFVQQGEKVTGTYEGRYGKWPLAGVLKNRVLDFAVTMNAEGTEATLTFRGEVSEDFKTILKGQADLGGMGEGSWTAKRNEK